MGMPGDSKKQKEQRYSAK